MFSFLGKAAKLFDVLKKRYSRKRQNFKKCSRSGVGSGDVNPAQKELEKYAFLSWLDQYIRPKKSRSNLGNDNNTDQNSLNSDDEPPNTELGNDDFASNVNSDDDTTSSIFNQMDPTKWLKRKPGDN